jgi:two-component system, NtrC family, response regulator GlrR
VFKLINGATQKLFDNHMIGESECFQRAAALVARFSKCDAPVLIEGETGTGKEVAARTVHYSGARRGRPFVPINCGALPDTLIENELFGHRQGAFTDAHGDIPGLIELANGGTLFFDEIDALSQRAQVILLRFFQDHRYRPLGGRKEETANVRIITASNRSLHRLADEGKFRADLFFRINILTVELPPLRKRTGDIRILAERFAHDCAKRYQFGHKTFTRDALAWLVSYPWPGNVRELENCIHRAYLLSDAPTLGVNDVDNVHSDATLQPGKSTYVDARKEALDVFHRQYLTTLLRQAGGNVTQAAREAGKERRALGKLVKKYGIAIPNSEAYNEERNEHRGEV